MIDILLASGDSWHTGILGVEIWSLLVSHMSHAKLKVEMDRRPRLKEFIKNYEKQSSKSVPTFTGLRPMATQEDPHADGRVLIIFLMTAFTASYVFKYSFTLKNIINLTYIPFMKYSETLIRVFRKNYEILARLPPRGE